MDAPWYYFDNWSGSKHRFDCKESAIQSAKKETGNYIILHGPNGYCKTIEASGHTPA